MAELKNNNLQNENKNDSSESWLKILKFVLGVIGFILFLVHTISLTIEYLKYKTVTNNNYLMPTQITMPAFTICAPVPIAFKRFCETNETMDNCYDRLNDKNTSYKPTLLAKLIQNYLTDGNISVLELNNKEMILSLDCSTMKLKPSINELPEMVDCYELTNTVSSIIYNAVKGSYMPDYCRTYFSMFDPQYDSSKYQVDLILLGNFMAVLQMGQTYNTWFPSWYEDRGIRMAIHPPNMIPNALDWNYNDIYHEKAYALEYSRTISVLLEPPYETNCNPYKSGAISKSDCERRCILEKSYDKGLNCINQWNVIILNELTNHTKLCPITEDNKLEYFFVRKQCNNACMTDCYIEKYNTKLKIYENKQYDTRGDYTEVVIKHSIEGDQEFVHKEATLFTTYIANVGGLGGLYLGLSLFALYETIISAFHFSQKMFRKLRKDTND